MDADYDSQIQDVASGLEHLHTRQPPICHGDLKSVSFISKPLLSKFVTELCLAEHPCKLGPPCGHYRLRLGSRPDQGT